MSLLDEVTLPGTPPPTLARVWGDLSGVERALVREHILQGTSADWLADTLREFGYTVSATTIRSYRRSLKGV